MTYIRNCKFNFYAVAVDHSANTDTAFNDVEDYDKEGYYDGEKTNRFDEVELNKMVWGKTFMFLLDGILYL